MLVTEITYDQWFELLRWLALYCVGMSFVGIAAFYVLMAAFELVSALVGRLQFVQDWRQAYLRRLLQSPEFVSRLSARQYTHMRREAGLSE